MITGRIDSFPDMSCWYFVGDEENEKHIKLLKALSALLAEMNIKHSLEIESGTNPSVILTRG